MALVTDAITSDLNNTEKLTRVTENQPRGGRQVEEESASVGTTKVHCVGVLASLCTRLGFIPVMVV